MASDFEAHGVVRIRRIDQKLYITMPLGSGAHLHIKRKQTRHAKLHSLPANGLREKHEASTLGVDGKPLQGMITNGSQEGNIMGKSPGVSLGEPASDIESIQMFRQR